MRRLYNLMGERSFPQVRRRSQHPRCQVRRQPDSTFDAQEQRFPGALLRHVSGEAHPDDYEYQPPNVVYALFPPLAERHKKQERKPRMLARARRELDSWAAQQRVPLGPEPATGSSNELRP